MTIFDLIKQYLRYDNAGMTVTRKGLVAYVQANAKQAKIPCSVNTIDTYCRMLRKIDILHSTNVPGIYAYQASKQIDKQLASLTSTQLYDKAYGEDSIIKQQRMKPIIQFLKSQVDTFTEDSEKVVTTEKDIETLTKLFINRSKTVNQTRHLKIQPRIQRNQIWTVKNEYDDFQGISQKTSHPFIVLINNVPDDVEGELSVRVLIISPFIEMATPSDELCNDHSIIGFPFLVETWNDQPILAELLDEYVGYYELKSKSFAKSEAFELVNEPITDYLKANSETLSEAQQEFRDIEISRAKYINHSVLSLLSFL